MAGDLCDARVLCVFVLAFGMLTGCGSPEDEDEQGETQFTQEPAKEAASGRDYAVVRVSGTPPGITYSGTYGTANEVRVVDDAPVEDEPTDYEVGTVETEDGVLNAAFSKTQLGREELRVEILLDGEVVTQSETSAELGSATVNWKPEGGLPEETLPREGEN